MSDEVRCYACCYARRTGRCGLDGEWMPDTRVCLFPQQRRSALLAQLSEEDRDALEVGALVMEWLDDPQTAATPWPDTIWKLTEARYCLCVPDERLRTAISGLMARFGWTKAVEQLRERIDALRAAAGEDGEEK